MKDKQNEEIGCSQKKAGRPVFSGKDKKVRVDLTHLLERNQGDLEKSVTQVWEFVDSKVAEGKGPFVVFADDPATHVDLSEIAAQVVGVSREGDLLYLGVDVLDTPNGLTLQKTVVHKDRVVLPFTVRPIGFWSPTERTAHILSFAVSPAEPMFYAQNEEQDAAV